MGGKVLVYRVEAEAEKQRTQSAHWSVPAHLTRGGFGDAYMDYGKLTFEWLLL